MDRVLVVLLICLPVFALVGLGKVLQIKGVLAEHDQGKLGWLVYYLSLPSLIFYYVAQQPFADLIDIPIVVSTLSVTVLVALLFFGLGTLCKLPIPHKSIVAWSPFWANVSYLGFILAERSFGAEGLAAASIVNAFTMPTFVLIGSLLLSFGNGHQVSFSSLGSTCLKALTNPIIMAAFAGIVVSGLISLIPQSVQGHALVSLPAQLVGDILALLGSMGLPLALICVGASLRATEVWNHWRLVACASLGKLVVTPLLVWLVFYLFFPDAPDSSRGVAVLLMATPMAVAAFVMSKQQAVAPELAAAHLVVSTALSCVSIPLWLYLIV